MKARSMMLALAIVTGCTGQTQPPPTVEQGTASPESLAPAQFVYALGELPTSLDPTDYQGDATKRLMAALGSLLFEYDSSGLPNAGCTQFAAVADLSLPKGGLVKSYAFNAEKTAVTAQLGDYTSQYGNKLTSQDVEWSVRRNTELLAVNQSINVNLGRLRRANPITVIDEKAFTINLDAPGPFSLVWTTSPMNMIYDSQEAKRHTTPDDPWAKKWLSTNLANFGPWVLESFNPGSQVVLTDNKAWPGKRGNITRLTIQAVPSEATRAQLVQAGTVDWTTRLQFDQYKSLQSVPGVKVFPCVSATRDTINLNGVKGFGTNPKVRQAIAEAIDRPAIVAAAYSGFASVPQCGMPSAFGLCSASSAGFKYDPVHAKALLAEAGFPNGLSLRLVYSAARPGPQVNQSGPLVQNMLAAIGIKAELVNVPSGTDFNTMTITKQFQTLDAVLFNESPSYIHPIYQAFMLRYLDGTNCPPNCGAWVSPAFDKLYEQTSNLPAGPEQDRLTLQMTEMISTENARIYLADVPYVYATRSNISGYQHAPNGELRPWQLIKR